VDDRRSDRPCHGFTLLELLIVLAVFGLIMVALSSGVRFAGRAWSTQQREIDRGGDVDAVQNTLRELVGSGRNFQGDAASLKFRGPLPRALGQSGSFDMTLQPVNDTLVLSWRRHAGDAAQSDATDEELLGGISGFTLSYFIYPDQGAGAWGSTIAGAAKPPALVRIAVAFQDSRIWLPLTVAPMIEIQSGK
jgi:prepilin-type N-terminal cleavage/methylation domain-containing protein